MDLLYDSSVLATLDSLPNDDRRRIRETLAALAERGTSALSDVNVERLMHGPNSYSVRVTPDFRLLLRVEGDRLRVVSLARKSYS